MSFIKKILANVRQNLSEEEKSLARENIGAMAGSYVMATGGTPTIVKLEELNIVKMQSGIYLQDKNGNKLAVLASPDIDLVKGKFFGVNKTGYAGWHSLPTPEWHRVTDYNASTHDRIELCEFAGASIGYYHDNQASFRLAIKSDTDGSTITVTFGRSTYTSVGSTWTETSEYFTSSSRVQQIPILVHAESAAKSKMAVLHICVIDGSLSSLGWKLEELVWTE